MIPDAAVEAAARAAWAKNSEVPWDRVAYGWKLPNLQGARELLEAAAPHMLAESDLMRWKLDALREWSDAMISESNHRQYGIDVKTILDVASMDEAKEVDAL